MAALKALGSNDIHAKIFRAFWPTMGEPIAKFFWTLSIMTNP